MEGLHSAMRADGLELGTGRVSAGGTWGAVIAGRRWRNGLLALEPHGCTRNLTQEKLVAGECVCSRTDCVVAMFKRFNTRKQKADKGSLEIIATGQPSPLGR